MPNVVQAQSLLTPPRKSKPKDWVLLFSTSCRILYAKCWPGF